MAKSKRPAAPSNTRADNASRAPSRSASNGRAAKARAARPPAASPRAASPRAAARRGADLRAANTPFIADAPEPRSPPVPRDVIPDTVDTRSVDFIKNAQRMAELTDRIRDDKSRIAEMGGVKNVTRQHAKGRLSVRERLDLLLDPGTRLFEIGMFAAWGMYREWGGAPCAGVVCGVGRIEGRDVMVIANDATVKAGAFFPMTAKKVIRAQTIAQACQIPVVYLVDSAGVFLPLQEDVFPDQDDFGRIFRNNAVMSAAGIPQLTAIMGPCVAGGAYLPVMCDYTLMTEGSGLYLAGPALVKAAIGQEVSSEDLGGAKMHMETSGTADFREPDDTACIARIRSLIARFGHAPDSAFHRIDETPPALEPSELPAIFTNQPGGEYDIRQIIARIVDGSAFDEYKRDFGQTLVCGYARIGGIAVGIVANQKIHIRKPGKAIEFGGVIYHESADKAARFMMTCNHNLIPLLFLHDVNGFMVGRDSEQHGIIRAGAKMVNVMSNSVVPKISLILGGSYGAGNYAMCGKAYDPAIIMAWPTCKYAVMSGDAAAKTLTDIRIRTLEGQGKTLSDAEKAEISASTKATYDEQTDARYAASRLWIDRIIEPQDTREEVKRALQIVANTHDVAEFKTGVLQV
jgi:acetyl-CoA carboxylase carboxyltransferase component